MNIPLKKTLVSICWLVGLIECKTPALAQMPAKYIPTSAVAQIMRPSDAQGIALGLTGVSYRDGLFSTYSNPAGLKFDYFKFSFSHVPASKYSYSNFNQEAFGLGLPLNKNLFFGVHFFNLNFGKIKDYDVNGNATEKRAGIRELQISGTKLFTGNQNALSLGLSVKYLQFYLLDIKANSILADAGVRYRIDRQRVWYSFGLAIGNLGNELKHNGLRIDKPIKLLRAGFAMGNRVGADSTLGLLGTIEYQRSMNDDKLYLKWSHVGIGLELQFAKYMFGRLGYNFDLADVTKGEKIKGMTYGIGFNTPGNFPVDLAVNYGKGIYDYRNFDVNVISVAVGFDL